MSEVAVARLPNRFAPGDKTHPSLPGFTRINVSSSSRQWSRGLSPMSAASAGSYLGQEATCFENLWQGGKLYDFHLTPFFPDRKGVLPEFFTRRDQMCADPQPHRRSYPKARGVPVSSLYDGVVYDYLSSRCLLYCPLYADWVQTTPAWAQLRALREPVLLVGYDGRDVEMTPENMVKEVLRTDAPFGHELVVACLLKGWAPWSCEEVMKRVVRTPGTDERWPTVSLL